MYKKKEISLDYSVERFRVIADPRISATDLDGAVSPVRVGSVRDLPRSSCTVFYFIRSRFGAMLILLHLVSSNLERSAQVRLINIVNTDVSAQAAIRTLLLPFASRVNIVDRIYHAGTRRARRSFVASLTHRMRGPVDNNSSESYADSGRSIVGTANPVSIYPAISCARIFTRSFDCALKC